MELDDRDFGENPESICGTRFDCIWVCLAKRNRPEPVRLEVLQWIDWRLRGSLSRYVLKGHQEMGLTTFIPTMNRIASPYVAVDQVEVDLTRLWRNCEGLHLEEILFVFEDKQASKKIKSTLKNQTQYDYPKKVYLASEGQISEKF